MENKKQRQKREQLLRKVEKMDEIIFNYMVLVRKGHKYSYRSTKALKTIERLAKEINGVAFVSAPTKRPKNKKLCNICKFNYFNYICNNINKSNYGKSGRKERIGR